MFSLKEVMESFERDLMRDDAIPSDVIIDIASGGVQARGAQPPVLCTDIEMAVRLWRMGAAEYAESQPRGTRFKWIDKPTLDRWQITITDAKVTHRLVSDRYAVFARIAVAPPLETMAVAHHDGW
jgi:hypothetical protein